MEKVINSWLTYYAIIAVATFTMWTLLYCSIGLNMWQWEALDKFNDRLLTVNLLFITCFIFRDVVYRLFTIISIGYIIGYAAYEFTFIRQTAIYGMSSILPNDFVNISLIYLTAGALILFIVAYVTKRSRE